MVNFLTLDKKGITLAFVFGVLIYFFGMDLGLLFLIDIIAFLVMSAVVTTLGRVKKEGIGTYENSRGWKNVLSNGLAPVLIAFVYFVNYTMGMLPRHAIAMMYIASVAAVAADKFASEIGVLDGDPMMLIGMKRVKKGISGGVTALGLASSFLASFIIGISALYLFGSIVLVLMVAVSGFFGNLVDSVLGYYERKGVGNKHTSNFFCSIAGAAACLAALIY